MGYFNLNQNDANHLYDKIPKNNDNPSDLFDITNQYIRHK